jgi:NTE family protein
MDARPQDPCSSDKEEVRIGVVLSAGGLRGAAHAGVLRQLVRHGVPLHAIVGVSAGAIVAAYYAAVGLELEEMIQDAETFRGRHLLAHSLSVRCGPRFAASLRSWCGVIPHRLRQLEGANFDRLYHSVSRLGIVCHDLLTQRPRYFGTGVDPNVTLSEAVRASASIPRLFPAVSVWPDGEALYLTDGGLSDPLPLTFAQRPAMGATHIVVSDCRAGASVFTSADTNVLWIRPSMRATGTLWSPRPGLRLTVAAGEAAVTAEVLRVITGWLTAGSPPAALTAAS